MRVKELARWRRILALAGAVLCVWPATAAADQRLTPRPTSGPAGWLSPSPSWHYWFLRMPWICRCCKGYGFTDCKYFGYHTTQWNQWPPNWTPPPPHVHTPTTAGPPKEDAETLKAPRTMPEKDPTMPEKMPPDKGQPMPEVLPPPAAPTAAPEAANPDQPRVVPVMGQPIPNQY